MAVVESGVSRANVDLVASARALMPLLEEEAGAAEAQRHLTDRAVAAMRDAGLYRMHVPAALGGFEADPLTQFGVIETLSQAHGSAGWCLMAGAMEAGAAAAYIEPEVAADMFSSNIVMAGQGIPKGHATPREGGFWLHGSFGYGSGIAHADFAHTGAIVFDGDKPRLGADGSPEIRVFHVPRAEIQIRDNWNVLGLRATGSFDYGIEGCYQSEESTYLLDETEPRTGGNLYSLGLKGFTALGHTAWAIGIGRRALDELRQAGTGQRNLFGLLGESSSFREKFALAEAKFRAARAFAVDVWGEAGQTLARGDQVGIEHMALLRLALRHSHDVVSEVCTHAHKAAVGLSLRDSVLQRCYRDMHAGTQHILMADQLVQDCGMALLGMAPEGARWRVSGLA